MLVRLASGDIGEEEACTTQRTKVAEQQESTEWPADAKITALTKQIYDVQFHGQGLAQNMMCNILFTHGQLLNDARLVGAGAFVDRL